MNYRSLLNSRSSGDFKLSKRSREKKYTVAAENIVKMVLCKKHSEKSTNFEF